MKNKFIKLTSVCLAVLLLITGTWIFSASVSAATTYNMKVGETITVKALKTPKVTVKGTEKAIKVTYNKVNGAKGFKVTYKIGNKTYNKKFTLSKKELKKSSVTKTIKVKKSGNYKVTVKAFVTSGKKTTYSKATKSVTVKCTSNNSDNNKAEVCKINGTSCKVGDKITVALKMKTPKVLINFQGYTDFDTSYLKFVSAKINVNGGLINCVNNSILYNGVNISKGYDFTTTGTLYTATFQVKKAGSTTIKNTMQVMSDMNMTDVKESDCKISVKVYS